MTRILFMLILCIGFQVKGQNVTREYYTDHREKTDDISLSEYYVLEMKNNEKSDTLKSFFTKTDNLRSQVLVDESGVRNGAYLLFHPNGIKASEGNYEDNIPVGIFKNWYPNGNQQSIESYAENQFQIVDYWDESGNQIVKAGSGFCECVFRIHQGDKIIERGKLIENKKDSVWTGAKDDSSFRFTEQYNLGELISGISYDKEGTSHTYTVIEEMATPKGGMQAFYKHVASRIVYPKYSRKKGIEGHVFVQFMIEKDGSISNVKTIKGIGGGCDEEAENVVKSHPAWNPPYQRGQRIRQRFIVPINFKLN